MNVAARIADESLRMEHRPLAICWESARPPNILVALILIESRLDIQAATRWPRIIEDWWHGGWYASASTELSNQISVRDPTDQATFVEYRADPLHDAADQDTVTLPLSL
jgi:hypothetical protein